MEGQEIIEMIKAKYKMKKPYTLEIFYKDEKYQGMVYKNVEVVDKKTGEINIATTSLPGGIETKSKENFKMFIETYCETI